MGATRSIDTVIAFLGDLVPPRVACGELDDLMPDISASLELLDATIFLYSSREDAEAGKNFGGSGVIVGAPLQTRPDLNLRFAVTNWHVACRDGFSVIRINSANGGTYIIEKDPSEWSFFPHKQDLAATILQMPAGTSQAIVASNMFIGHAESPEAHVGDDAFMVGRFIDYDGHETNHPAARFGFVSMMNVKVRQPTGYNGCSIVVDMHARSGFSGSPVYVYRPGNIRVHTDPDPKLVDYPGFRATRRRWGTGNNVLVRLLGILRGQFPERWELSKSTIAARTNAAPPLIAGAYVEGFSGLSCVIPAEDILQILHHPDFNSYWRTLNALGMADHIPVPM